MLVTKMVESLASTVKLPAMLVHMRCQQAAKSNGIVWGAEVTATEAATITATVVAKFGK